MEPPLKTTHSVKLSALPLEADLQQNGAQGEVSKRYLLCSYSGF